MTRVRLRAWAKERKGVVDNLVKGGNMVREYKLICPNCGRDMEQINYFAYRCTECRSMAYASTIICKTTRGIEG